MFTDATLNMLEAAKDQKSAYNLMKVIVDQNSGETFNTMRMWVKNGVAKPSEGSTIEECMAHTFFPEVSKYPKSRKMLIKLMKEKL